MDLLLLHDVPKLGYIGDVVKVNVGYARNYLLPQRLATEPTSENIAAIADAKKRAAEERARRFKEWETLAAALANVSVTIEAAANEEGTLYGSVGPRQVAEALHAAGHAVHEKFVVLAEPIRQLDNRAVTIRFNDDISASVKVWVVREGGAAQDEQSAKPDDADDGETNDE